MKEEANHEAASLQEIVDSVPLTDEPSNTASGSNCAGSPDAW